MATSDFQSRVNVKKKFMKVSSSWHYFVFILAGLVSFQIIAFLLVFLAELIPDKLIADALVEGVDRNWITAAKVHRTGLDNRVDRSVECTALTMGLGDDPDSTSLETAITNPTLGACRMAIPGLMAYKSGEDLKATFHYFRYWHGYTIITRPSLALFGVAGTRMIALAIAGFAFIWFLSLLFRDTDFTAVALLVIPIVLSTDFVDLAESTPHAIAFGTLMLSLALAWKLLCFRPSLAGMFAGGVIAGCFTTYFDLMVFFPGSLAMVTTLSLVKAHMVGWRKMKLFLSAVAAGTGWMIGFAFTWGSKWLLAMATFGFENVYGTVSDQIAYRLKGDHYTVSSEIGTALERNVVHWLDRPLGTVVVVAGLCAIAVMVYRGFRDKDVELSSSIILLGPMLIPLVWFEVLSSHSQIHFWITYKSLGLTLGIVLFAMYVSSSLARNESNDQPGARSQGR